MTRRPFWMVAVFSRKQMIWFLLEYVEPLMQGHFRDFTYFPMEFTFRSLLLILSHPFMTVTHVGFPLIPQTLVLYTASSDSCKEFCPTWRLLTSFSVQCAVCSEQCAVSSVIRCKATPGKLKPIQEVFFKEANIPSHLKQWLFFLPAVADIIKYSFFTFYEFIMDFIVYKYMNLNYHSNLWVKIGL